MKIFSLRNILGVAAIYGVAQYAKKQGGFRPAFENVMDKLRNLGQQAEQQLGGREHMGEEEVGAHIRTPSETTGSSFATGGYTGSGSEGAVSGEIGGNTGGGSSGAGSSGQPR